MAYLNDKEFSLIANEAVDVAGKLSDGESFECYYNAWEEGNNESIND
jgi:hypothetical protein